MDKEPGHAVSPYWILMKWRRFPPHLIDRFVLAQSDVNGVPQSVVGGPGQVRDPGDELWLDPRHARERTSGEPKTDGA